MNILIEGMDHIVYEQSEVMDHKNCLLICENINFLFICEDSHCFYARIQTVYM